MNTDSVRLNITLPKDLVEALNRVAGARQRNRFITESLQQRLARMEKIALEQTLADGYREMAKEGNVIARDFEVADLEGWDEY